MDNLKSMYEERRETIQKRLNEFKAVPVSEYFYELAYCLLTPQTSALHAQRAVDVLKEKDFQNRDINPLPCLHRRDFYIRFHHTKAKRLIRLKDSFPGVFPVLSNETLPAFEKRFVLVQKVEGYGLKEATHALRNIGKNEGLAILDRHILRNLLRFGVIHEIPASLPPKRYYAIEKKFFDFADGCGIPTDELDLLFWSMETGEIAK